MPNEHSTKLQPDDGVLVRTLTELAQAYLNHSLTLARNEKQRQRIESIITRGFDLAMRIDEFSKEEG